MQYFQIYLNIGNSDVDSSASDIETNILTKNSNPQWNSKSLEDATERRRSRVSRRCMKRKKEIMNLLKQQRSDELDSFDSYFARLKERYCRDKSKK
jgi:hypothetical protein